MRVSALGGSERRPTRALATVVLVALAWAFPTAGSALAATIYPTRVDDPAGAGNCPSNCSLRQAVAAAAPGDTVSLAPPAPPGPYSLTQGPVTIVQPVTISGVDARTSTISAASSSIFIDQGAAVTLSGLDLTGVAATDFVVQGSTDPSLTLLGVSIQGNPGGSGAGGGAIAMSGGTLRVANSTIADNKGQGVSDASGTVEMSDSTIASNDSVGFSLAGATTTIASSTVAFNGAAVQGNMSVAGGSLTVRNSIVADSDGPQNCSFAGVTVTAVYDIDDTTQCDFTGTDDQSNTNPQLLALAHYGGPVDTIGIAATSPAVNAGDPSGCTDAGGAAVTTDERGAVRGDRCDIGAFEYQLAPANTALPAVAGSPVEGATVTCGTGAWSGGTPLTYGYTWLRDGAPISGATGATYTIPTGTAHHAFSCRVTAANFTDFATAASPSVTVAAPPAVISALKISPSKASTGGRKVAGRCVKQTAKNKHKHSCRLSIKLTVSYTLSAVSAVTFSVKGKGSFVEHGRAGANRFKWNGKLNGHSLRPATYRLSATPAGGAGEQVKFVLKG